MLQKIKINYRQKYKFQMSNPVQYLVHIGHGRNWQPLFKDQEQVIVNACVYLELASHGIVGHSYKDANNHFEG